MPMQQVNLARIPDGQGLAEDFKLVSLPIPGRQMNGKHFGMVVVRREAQS